MITNYKTGRLPQTFVSIGVLFLVIGIWRTTVMDWMGIILLLISFFLLFLKSGILIDSDSKKMKQYTGFLTYKKGKWEDISTIKHLFIAKVKETQRTSMLSISTIVRKTTHKLYLVFPDKKTEIIAGKESFITKNAKKIANELQITIIDKSNQ
jgi:hypothetical protein